MNDFDWSFLGGVVVGILLTLGWVMYRINSLIDKMVNEVEGKITSVQGSLIGVEIERVDGVIYCYNQKDRQFICQGATIQDIRQAFKERFPGKGCYIAGGDEQLIEEFRTAINEDNLNK